VNVTEIMTPNPCTCSPSDSIREVARVMRDNDCGAVPIVEGASLIGIVTDRDLVVRAIAAGHNLDAKVSDILTANPRCCDAAADISEVERIMTEHQVRRVPVIDVSGTCVGIVSQADLARAAARSGRVTDREVAIVVETISQPRRFDRGRPWHIDRPPVP
jgi:CBS domain-containing protein